MAVGVLNPGLEIRAEITSPLLRSIQEGFLENVPQIVRECARCPWPAAWQGPPQTLMCLPDCWFKATWMTHALSSGLLLWGCPL